MCCVRCDGERGKVGEVRFFFLLSLSPSSCSPLGALFRKLAHHLHRLRVWLLAYASCAGVWGCGEREREGEGRRHNKNPRHTSAGVRRLALDRSRPECARLPRARRPATRTPRSGSLSCRGCAGRTPGPGRQRRSASGRAASRWKKASAGVLGSRPKHARAQDLPASAATRTTRPGARRTCWQGARPSTDERGREVRAAAGMACACVCAGKEKEEGRCASEEAPQCFPLTRATGPTLVFFSCPS